MRKITVNIHYYYNTVNLLMTTIKMTNHNCYSNYNNELTNGIKNF